MVLENGEVVPLGAQQHHFIWLQLAPETWLGERSTRDMVRQRRIPQCSTVARTASHSRPPSSLGFIGKPKEQEAVLLDQGLVRHKTRREISEPCLYSQLAKPAAEA